MEILASELKEREESFLKLLECGDLDQWISFRLRKFRRGVKKALADIEAARMSLAKAHGTPVEGPQGQEAYRVRPENRAAFDRAWEKVMQEMIELPTPPMLKVEDVGPAKLSAANFDDLDFLILDEETPKTD